MQNLLNKIASHFQINPSEIKVAKIRHGNREKQNVRCLKIRGKRYLLKQHEITVPVPETGYTPFQIEKFTLSTLYKAGCLVPHVIWESEKDHALLLEWRGEQTLDSIAQRSAASSVQSELNTILRVLCKIERTFAENSALIKPYIFHFNVKEILQELT